MNVQMKWQEPPQSKAGRGRAASRERDAVVAQLKEHPGRWALVQEQCRNSGAGTSWRQRGCEATAVRRDDGKGYDVYARWPEVDPAEVDPYVARRRAKGVPRDGRPASNGLRSVS